jgi:hypothetical protein
MLVVRAAGRVSACGRGIRGLITVVLLKRLAAEPGPADGHADARRGLGDRPLPVPADSRRAVPAAGAALPGRHHLCDGRRRALTRDARVCVRHRPLRDRGVAQRALDDAVARLRRSGPGAVVPGLERKIGKAGGRHPAPVSALPPSLLGQDRCGIRGLAVEHRTVAVEQGASGVVGINGCVIRGHPRWCSVSTDSATGGDRRPFEPAAGNAVLPANGTPAGGLT